MAKETHSPKSRFGAELRRRREEKGWTQRSLAAHLGYGHSLIGHIERGTRNPQKVFAERCDEVFGLDGYFVRLWRLTNEAPTGPLWYAKWKDEIEPEAEVLRTWDPLVIPGLLQTEAYARALIAGGESAAHEIEDRVRARMGRRGALERAKPPELWVFLDEGYCTARSARHSSWSISLITCWR
ncbi:hypothetical protein DP939_40385 [Spongiactinospora rosea]|uniref:HTH cro/C1-type domain-containing protein n=1 Tax=Spongiactinospora rosea TaxID=2248750 RepID=A0A366LLZ1_9ACTN|nr:hypothetical protein DP939_40385 [Spongiactinospora rosea]